jgi:hypothetical protein
MKKVFPFLKNQQARRKLKGKFGKKIQKLNIKKKQKKTSSSI